MEANKLSGGEMGSGCAGASRGVPSGSRDASSSYLEQSRESVTVERKVVGKEWLEVRACGCGSWFCERCCLSKGIRLKERLKSKLVEFTGLMMLTFTLDPELFPGGPREAYEYVTCRRCVSVAMQRLDRWKLIHSRRFLTVIEWQKNGWPHWHVLVDATRIPFDKLREAWNRNWKGWEARVALGRPGFGSVRFSAERLERERAAGYVTAYLTKVPPHGFPSWVLACSSRRVHRFQPSRGFWDGGSVSMADEGDEAEEGAVDGSAVDGVVEKVEKLGLVRTVAEVVSACGSRSVALRAREVVDERTGEVAVVRDFLFDVPMPVAELSRFVGGYVQARASVIEFAELHGSLDRVREAVGRRGGS